MGRHALSPSDEKISTHPIGKILALPAKGEPSRKTAITSYALLVGGVFSTLTWATLNDDPAPTRTAKPQGVREDDAYTHTPEPGYQPTYLDGGGGIAGVPLTDEQRKALIAEARRRGLSVSEAYALAYGDGVRLRIGKNGKVQVDTSEVTVPDRPVYIRAVQPATDPRVEQVGLTEEKAEGTTSAAGRSQAKEKDEKPAKAQEKPAQGKGEGKGKQGKGKGKEADDGYYDSSGDNYYEEEEKEKDSGLKSVLPPALDSLVDSASEVTGFLSQASPGEVTVVGPVQRGNHVMMMMSAPLAEDLTVKTTIATPIEAEAPVQPVVTTVAVNTDTGEVVAKEKDTCDDVSEVPTVAIKQVVDVVLEAREEMGPQVPIIAAESVETPEAPAEDEQAPEVVGLETPVREEDVAVTAVSPDLAARPEEVEPTSTMES
ncbi:hypothetical protein HRW13_20410 [Streptomyces lunaelactis]|nr:hypothetical protein [Streptomyces lunaelactis]